MIHFRYMEGFKSHKNAPEDKKDVDEMALESERTALKSKIEKRNEKDAEEMTLEEEVSSYFEETRDIEKFLRFLEDEQASAINKNGVWKRFVINDRSEQRAAEIRKMKEDFEAAGIDSQPSAPPKENVTISDLEEELSKIKYIQKRAFFIRSKEFIGAGLKRSGDYISRVNTGDDIEDLITDRLNELENKFLAVIDSKKSKPEDIVRRVRDLENKIKTLTLDLDYHDGVKGGFVGRSSEPEQTTNIDLNKELIKFSYLKMRFESLWGIRKMDWNKHYETQYAPTSGTNTDVDLEYEIYYETYQDFFEDFTAADLEFNHFERVLRLKIKDREQDLRKEVQRLLEE